MTCRHPHAANSSASAQSTSPSLAKSPDLPAVLISPIKARAVNKNVVNKTDVEVRHLSDQEIIGVYLVTGYLRLEVISCHGI
jgi:hypothetical protein